MQYLRWLRGHFSDYIMELLLVAMCVFLSACAPGFFTVGNFFNVLRSVTEVGLIAFGMTMVIIAGEIDLSVGSGVAFSGCLTAYLASSGVPIPASILLALLAGMSWGSFTGVMRTRFQVPTFITTLALMTILRGGANLITGGFPITSFPGWYNFLGSGYFFNKIPFPALILVFAFFTTYFLMDFTTFGRAVYAVGGNAEAARLSGINVSLIRILVLAITGMLAALSGVLLSARIMSGTPTVGVSMELEVIAAVIIGGTSFTGGVGTIWGTLIGVIFIGVIVNGMTLLNVPIYGQYVVRGLIILAAVLVNRLQEKK